MQQQRQARNISLRWQQHWQKQNAVLSAPEREAAKSCAVEGSVLQLRAALCSVAGAMRERRE